MPLSEVPIQALAAAIGFVLLAGFQVALAAGAPWGRVAWGGTHEGRLPAGFRVASAFAAAFWILAALVMLARGGWDGSPVSSGMSRWATWVLFGLLVVGTLMNAASRSRLERIVQTPVAAILAVLTLLTALLD